MIRATLGRVGAGGSSAGAVTRYQVELGESFLGGVGGACSRPRAAGRSTRGRLSISGRFITGRRRASYCCGRRRARPRRCYRLRPRPRVRRLLTCRQRAAVCPPPSLSCCCWHRAEPASTTTVLCCLRRVVFGQVLLVLFRRTVSYRRVAADG